MSSTSLQITHKDTDAWRYLFIIINIIYYLYIIIVSIYQTSEYQFSRALIGYSSSEYPVISTGWQNTMDVRRTHAFPAKFRPR